jgi:paraquat-inducible protein B
MKTQFSVGVLVLVGFGLLIGFTLFLTGERLRNRGELYETYIRESVQGLEVGASVRFRGVAVGRVTEIALVGSRYVMDPRVQFSGAFQLVLVRFTLDLRETGRPPSLPEAVELGLRARLSSQGLTGVGYIELDFADVTRFPAPELPFEPAVKFIPSIPSTTAQVQDAATMLLSRLEQIDFQALIGNITGLVSDVRAQTAPGGDLQVALADASSLMRSLRSTVETADLPGMVAEARAAVAAARSLLDSRDLRQMLSQGGAAMAELRAAAARLPPTITQLEAGLRSARGATLDVQADLVPILRDLRAMTTNLRDVTEALRRSPSQTLLGGPPPVPAGASR